MAKSKPNHITQGILPGMALQPVAGAHKGIQGPRQAESESLEEMSEVLKGFKARAAREDARMADATDSEYYVCLCFQTTAQVEEFMQKLGVEVWQYKFVDGLEVAQKMGIAIESPCPRVPKLKVDPKLTELALPVGA